MHQGSRYNWIPTMFIGLVVSFMIVLFSSAYVSRNTDGPHAEVSMKSYSLADNSQISTTSGKIKFFYMEDKTLKVYEDYVKDVKIQSSNGKTIEIRNERYDLGTGILPWGMDRVDTTAVVK